MKLAVFTIAIAMCCLGCYKEVSDHSFEDSKNIPSIIQSSRSYSLDQLIELANTYDNNLSGRSVVDLSSQDFKYALETKINRDFRAGSNQGSSRQSHLLFIDYELDSNGMIPSPQFESIENQITYQIDYLVSLGAKFYIVDVEVLEGQQILVDIITVVGYVNTDLSFGYAMLPNNGSYQPVVLSFDNIINDRIFFEEIDDSEYFLTDMYPNENIYPYGMTIDHTEIIGPLGISDCLMYEGTLEIYGGPELVYGNNNNQEIWMSGSQVNSYIMKGINEIESRIPNEEGMQLISLEFHVGYNGNNIGGDCLADGCDEFYPCFAYYHYWKEGFAARKALINK